MHRGNRSRVGVDIIKLDFNNNKKSVSNQYFIYIIRIITGKKGNYINYKTTKTINIPWMRGGR